MLNEQATIDENKFNQIVYSLGAYKDADGLIRLKGRLENSDLSDMAKFPLFIPNKCCLDDLIIFDAHVKVLHSGVKDTLTEVRSEFWLVQGRSKVGSLLRKCFLCRKFGAKLLQKPPAAPLPDFRAQVCDPFSSVGVDYLGVIFVYSTPRNKDVTLQKVYVCLFTCATTRAIHLDIVPDASCEAFINCLRRFIGRRGTPKMFVSDNAKCFVGEELKRFAKLYDMEWQLIVEKSPWWGGFYERMVQVVKLPL